MKNKDRLYVALLVIAIIAIFVTIILFAKI